jgi:hypothetical protein
LIPYLHGDFSGEFYSPDRAHFHASHFAARSSAGFVPMIGRLGAQVAFTRFYLIIEQLIARHHRSTGCERAGCLAFTATNAPGFIYHANVADGSRGHDGIFWTGLNTGWFDTLPALRDSEVIRVGFKGVLDDLNSG